LETAVCSRFRLAIGQAHQRQPEVLEKKLRLRRKLAFEAESDSPDQHI